MWFMELISSVSTTIQKIVHKFLKNGQKRIINDARNFYDCRKLWTDINGFDDWKEHVFLWAYPGTLTYLFRLSSMKAGK